MLSKKIPGRPADQEGKALNDRLAGTACHQDQAGGPEIFAFGVDGKANPAFAAVSRAHRDGEVLEGSRRPEVISHIRAIRRYLESEDALLPNAVVIAFDDRVEFRTATKGDRAFSSTGLLRIRLAVKRSRAGLWTDNNGQRQSARPA